MNDPVSVPGSAEPAQFFGTWAHGFSKVLGQIAGTTVNCAVLEESPEVAPASESDLWIIAAVSGGLRGEMSLRLPAAAVAHFAKVLMGEAAASPTEMTPEQREAALELIRQVAGLVSTSLQPRWGEVQLRTDAAQGAPTWSASATAWLRAGDDLAASALVELNLSAALTAGLRAEKKAEAFADAVPVPSAVADSSVNLGLLMDVELAISLRFGSRRLLLRDVLDLAPGAVVELDRLVDEPVDLLLDGRVLARGEVVVMDGNYALRVSEVAPPQGW
jgi:flagellar motor switch protein FliN